MENTANDLDREAHRPQAIRGGARAAPRQARLAVNQEVRKLIADVEDLMARIADASTRDSASTCLTHSAMRPQLVSVSNT